MTFPRPSLPQFRTTIRQQFQARFPTADLTQPNSVIGVLCDTFAGTIYSEFGYLDWLAQQLLPDTAESDYLDRWGTIFGLSRNPAQSAAGNVIFSGVSGTLIPVGTTVQDNSNNVYTTQPTIKVTGAILLTGGTGYSNGTRNIAVSGGIGTTSAILNVTIASGAVTSINSVAAAGSYVSVPSPATLAGGTATVSLTTTPETAGAPIGTGGTSTIQVESNLAGSNGNQAAGAPVNLVQVISNVLGSAVFDGAGATGGSDQEADASYRGRVLARIQTPPQGGSQNDYVDWVLATPAVGATRAFVYPLQQGVGTVGVTFVCDGRATQANPSAIIPTAGDVDRVAGYINNLRPVTANITVYAPVAIPVNFTLSISPSNVTTQTNVKAALFDMFTRLSTPGGVIYASQIIDAIMQVPGIIRTTIASPSGDINMNAGGSTPANFAVLGTVTFS